MRPPFKKKVGILANLCFLPNVQNKRIVSEKDLAALAKTFREKAGKSKADAARELGVAAPSIFNAEEQPEMSLTKLRIRLIETYSPYKVSEPVFVLTRKS